MRADSHLQLAAILSLVIAALGAELAALALNAQPGSAFLWRLNLELFAGINAGFRLVDGVVGLNPAVTIAALSAAAGLAALAYACRARLVLSTMSNAAFLVCGFLAFAWYHERFGGPGRTASLDNFAAAFDAGGMLLAFLLAASAAGFAMTHLTYIYAVRRERRQAVHEG